MQGCPFCSATCARTGYIDQAWEAYDLDGSGLLDLQEFAKMMDEGIYRNALKAIKPAGASSRPAAAAPPTAESFMQRAQGLGVSLQSDSLQSDPPPQSIAEEVANPLMAAAQMEQQRPQAFTASAPPPPVAPRPGGVPGEGGAQMETAVVNSQAIRFACDVWLHSDTHSSILGGRVQRGGRRWQRAD